MSIREPSQASPRRRVEIERRVGPIAVDELAWAAGVMEGEGSIRISRPTDRNRGSLCVDMVNTDLEIVAPFPRMWGGSVHRVESKGRRRAHFRWRAGSLMAAACLRDLLPHLRSARNQERARLALDFQAQKIRSTGRATLDGYIEEQWRFYDRMAAMNVRGVQ